MYRVVAIYGDKEYPLHEPRDPSGELRVIGGKLTQEAGQSEVLTFTISPEHPQVSRLIPLVTEIRAYDGEAMIFSGRMRKDNINLYNLREVTCEGEISYLCDSIQRPYDSTGTLAEFYTQLLAVHNSQVEERKRFELGMISVAGGDREWVSDRFETTLATIRGKLTEEYGGFLRIRRQNGKRYLDYVTDYGGTNSQPIRFGENLLDISRYRNPTSLITALIPRGAEIESEDTEAKQYVDITSVNGGKDYIFDREAVNTYGWLYGGHDFKDAASPEALLAKARALLEDHLALPETLEINAVDLSLIGVAANRLQVGFWTRVESVPHGLGKQLLLTKKSTYFDSPEKDMVWLGQTLPSFVGSQNAQKMEITDRVQNVAISASKEINRKIENATKLLTGGKGGYFVIGLSEDGHPEETFWMDTPNKETSKNVVRINKNGFGFSTTGIHGPYRNAWTIDGNLVADFITVGSMLADRIRGGTLELGGTGLGKDGSLIIRNTLNNLIGQFDKNGIIIRGGKLELGGDQDGEITVKDENGKVIGTWDKAGLSILKGILRGISAIFGGVDDQNGSLEVQNASGRMIGRWNKDGIYIRNGVIENGPFYSDQDGVEFGDWAVSADGSNVLRSQDGSVILRTRGRVGPVGDHPLLTLESEGNTTELSSYHLLTITIKTLHMQTQSMHITGTDHWDGEGYEGNLNTILDTIWTGESWSLERLRDDLNDLEDRVSSLENS